MILEVLLVTLAAAEAAETLRQEVICAETTRAPLFTCRGRAIGPVRLVLYFAAIDGGGLTFIAMMTIPTKYLKINPQRP